MNKFDGEFPEKFTPGTAAGEITMTAEDVDTVGEILVALGRKNNDDPIPGHWLQFLGRTVEELAERFTEIARRMG